MATRTVNNRIRNGVNGAQAGVIDLTVNNPVVAAGNSDLPVASSQGAIIAGDMLYLTAAFGYASLSTPGASNANAASFKGVSADTYPIVITDGITAPFAQGAGTGSTVARVQYYKDGDFRFHSTAAQTYNVGALVYLGADGQTISTVATGVSIGKVAPDQRAVGGVLGTAITGAAGQDVVITITPVA